MTQTQAFLLTLAVEVPVVVGLVHVRKWAPGRLVVVGFFAVLATAITHPSLWFLAPRLSLPSGFGVLLVLLEGAIVLVEAAVYAFPAALGFRRGLVLSLASNAASLAVGLAVYGLG